MAKDSYEVYYHQNGRWQLHASFEGTDRDKAIAEATQVEAKEGYATRVVRETFYPESNTSEETISWQSAKAKSINDADSMFGPKPKAPPKKEKKAPPPPPRQAAPEKPRAPPPKVAPKAVKKPKSKVKKRSALVRFILAIAISFGLAGLASVVLAFVIAYLPSIGVRLPATTNLAQITQGTFVLLFFITFIINLQREFNIFAMLRGNKSTKRAAAPALKAAPAKKQFTQDVEFDQVEIEDLREKILLEDKLAEEEETLEGLEDGEPADLGADMETETHTAEEPAPAPEPAPAVQQQAAPEPKKPEPKAEEKKAAPPEKPAEKQKSPAEVEARTGLTRFINDTVNTIRQDQLNAFSRFGANLYLAGAASTIGQAKRLPRDVQLTVLKDGLVSTGNPPDRAESFCVELPTHGKNPRYSGMIQAGAKAMSSHMSGDRNLSAGLTNLLQEWNLPEKRPTVPSVFTFVFTDIVGSTAMTQKLGNAGAQKAVRAHNNAVRGAIQAQRGREVKHTGDGIMATFPNPASAVQAVIQMQRDIAAHNSANPNVEVGVRIGVNVGEAVEEENDFFGAAVQMTARICDKATKGNIWVSQAVVDACKGQKVGFIPRGKFEMKGIQGAKILYEVGWSDAHKNELADL